MKADLEAAAQLVRIVIRACPESAPMFRELAEHYLNIAKGFALLSKPKVMLPKPKPKRKAKK